MRNKILIFDPEIFDEQSVLEKMKYRTNDPLATLHKVEDLESFSREIIYGSPWKIIIVNFQTPEFWDTKPSDIEKFIKSIREFQNQFFEIIAVTGYKNQISILSKLGCILHQKQYNGIHSDTAGPGNPRVITIEDIVSIASDHFKVSKEEIIGRSKKVKIIKARNMAMYLVRLFTKHSLKEVGVFFSGRDHSTVKKQIVTTKNEMSSDELYRGDFLILRQKVIILQNTDLVS
ncbi:hypothetical protein IT399_03895 [Candidatus Nomurabacteria bacterium]|nr:hypothetical protein [Candidatus Nomurabacteria bacterium]